MKKRLILCMTDPDEQELYFTRVQRYVGSEVESVWVANSAGGLKALIEQSPGSTLVITDLERIEVEPAIANLIGVEGTRIAALRNPDTDSIASYEGLIEFDVDDGGIDEWLTQVRRLLKA